ncbi:MAG TPA: hypothetical protein VMR73_01535 [Candidatus Paceibacterota bacterium]|nr:hypothetical protein [Candidatus Paceibacterota bacterium]
MPISWGIPYMAMDWLSKIMTALFDIIAPQDASVAFIESLSADEFIQKAAPLKIGREIPYTIIPFEYQSPLVRKSVWEIKFRGNKKSRIRSPSSSERQSALR